ncbi:MAG: PEGA domain-containing protein [Myxococcales bacterium]|nr:PEGA domain-containing protein [Myxococcales bacterium]
MGKINVVGPGIEDSTVYIDGQVACERGPCLKALQQGDHVVKVTRGGFKSYARRMTIQAKAQMQVPVPLARTPSRSDAVVAYVLAAGFTGGGIFLGLQANKYRDQLKDGINGNPPVNPNDSRRFTKGKIFAIAADATFVVAGITALTAVYYTFREGPAVGCADRCPRAPHCNRRSVPSMRGLDGGSLVMRGVNLFTGMLTGCALALVVGAGCKWTEFDDLEVRPR